MLGIKLGFAPYLDCAVLAAAHEKGFASKRGLKLELRRYSTVRGVIDALSADSISAGLLPITVPLLPALDLSGSKVRFETSFIASRGGASFVVSNELADKLMQDGMKIPDAASMARAAWRDLLSGEHPRGRYFKFAVDHGNSSTAQELVFLLQHAGLVLGQDFVLIECGPKDAIDCLATGALDGIYGVEPWGTYAVSEGIGKVVTTKSHIWQNAPEKALVTTQDFSKNNQEQYLELIRVFYQAAKWCSEPANRKELAEILSAPKYLNMEEALILPGLTGFIAHSSTRLLECPDYFVTHNNCANFPWLSQASWYGERLLRQIVDCQIDDCTLAQLVSRKYRPDLYRQALEPLNVPIPKPDYKIEGSTDMTVPQAFSNDSVAVGSSMFFDGSTYI